ncbi:2-dehydropantoate 2-reductase [Neobacillus massiliamazoniensis]|uniref:2-dehydropantoate 2-reductase n=1 Tax=Neobacillus massiliamazoniensis TaxID=1499688 RepID=A0A0U1NRC2_9BACI|nr:2-dehydropantoate 2-reductase [Neobacillus massiliamazoniensis]CRK80591.1 2-dehydropantoate 2-reductase [Neobacillus massiliamazoniensis]
MQIGIIGAGAIGLLYASYLYNYFSVTIYTRTIEQADEINKHGLILQKESKQRISFVKSMPISKWNGTEDVTIIAVKQYQLNAVVDKIKQLMIVPKNLLFLQNGMGHLKLLEKIPAENIFVGSVEHGAMKVNMNTVCHNGEGVTKVAVFKGDPTALHVLATALPSDFLMNEHDDFYEMLLHKLIINAIINPLTAILQVENGQLLENPYYYKAARNLFAEVAAIVNLKHAEQHFEQICHICRQTAANRSSMLKDVEANRKTEIDAILGFLLEEATKNGKKAPLIETLYDLVKGKENGWREC